MDSIATKVLKRRATLKDSLKSPGNEELLLKDLKERRLQRQSLNSPQSRNELQRSLDDSTTKQQLPQGLHQLREQSKFTRFDEPLTDPPIVDVKEQTTKVSLWKSVSSNVSDVIKKTGDQKSYDFFTSAVHKEHSLLDTKSLHVGHEDFIARLLKRKVFCCSNGDLESKLEEEAESEDQESSQYLNKERLDNLEYPLYTPRQDRVNQELQVYFRPSSLPEVKSMNHVREEGIFVGEQLGMPQSRKAAMENRILMWNNKDSGWFGEDGLFLVDNNPLRKLHTRPHLLECENSECSVFQGAEVKVASQNLINKGSSDVYQLELDVSSIHFFHHPLFSYEHIISSELEKYYMEYSTRDINAAEYYNEKLQALKKKIINLKQKFQEEDSLSVAAVELQTYINLYRKEVCAIRQYKKRILESEYTLLKKILRLWKDLKQARENQGYSNTTTWLVITKVETNVVDEETQVQRNVEDEMFDLRENFEQVKSREDSSGHPPTFDEDHARSVLFDFYYHHLKPPGEPLLIPELHHSNTITKHCPVAEQLRRDDVSRTRLHVKVFFNHQQVSQTKDSILNSDFSVNFGEVFSIQIVQWPESIKLQIFETKLLTSSLVAEVFVPIPEFERTTKSSIGIDQYQFTSNKAVTFSHTAVGSGGCLSLPVSPVPLTSGYLNVAICWGVTDDNRVLCPGLKTVRSNYTEAVNSFGIAGATNLQDIKKWMEKSMLDPNDPRNSKLLLLLDTLPTTSEQVNYFQIVDVENVQSYISENQFHKDKRFTMLSMRDQGHHGLKNKVVPLLSESISGSMWKKILEYKNADCALPLLIFGDFYSSRREEQNKFLVDVRERVLSRIHSGRNVPLLSEIVISEFIPNISALKLTLAELFIPRRPLKPPRKERKALKSQSLKPDRATIVVRIVRAFNVPIRDDMLQQSYVDQQHRNFFPSTRPIEGREHASEENLFTVDLGHVSPYFEVSYGDTVVRTTTSRGTNPFWNEELTISFQVPDVDFSPSKIQVITSNIYINLFDEVVVDILEDDRKRATTLHHRIEKRWLGKLTIPFSTLIIRQMIEGTFQLDSPCILLGYKSFFECNPLLGFNTNHHTHVQLFINLDPPLDILPPIGEEFPSNEDISRLQLSSKWLKKLRGKFPSRNFTATALDTGGNHMFVTRFIKPQNPPPDMTSPGVSQIRLMERLAQFVSLIPFLPDAIVFSENCNIWTTSDQFLQMLGGDEEEHALLLCNYFLYHGFKSWVILGHAIPEGETAYVMTENPEAGGSGLWLWNPSTGLHYSQHQPHIPLISVGCVFNDRNVWGNIQSFDDPSRLMFDLSNREHWCALYPDGAQPLASVQQDLEYSVTDHERVMELQEQIERSLRDHIMTLRSHFITRWNRHCARILQTMLPILEEDQPSLSDCLAQLAETRNSYKLTGFPIQVRYSDMQQLLRTVERTGIHLCEDKKVEYSMAVYVHSYPNDVLSVWIFVVSMIPKQNH